MVQFSSLYAFFLTAISNRGLRNCFFLRFIYFFQFLFGLLLPIFSLDFYFPFSIWTFISLFIWTFISRHFETFWDISRHFEHFETFRDVSRHFETFRDISRHFETFRSFFDLSNRGLILDFFHFFLSRITYIRDHSSITSACFWLF